MDRLAERIGRKGIKEAEALVADTSHDVIRYAFKIVPKQTGANGLGSRIEALLGELPAHQASEYRANLLAAKQSKG